MGYRVNNDSCKGIGSNKILFSVGLYYLLAVLCTQKLHLSRINQRKSHQSVDSWMQHLFCNTARVSKATGWFGNWQCLKPSRCTEPLPDFFLKKYRNNLQQEHTSTLKNRQRHIDLKANMTQQVWEGPYHQLNYQNTAQLQYRAAKELLWKFS